MSNVLIIRYEFQLSSKNIWHKITRNTWRQSQTRRDEEGLFDDTHQL